MHLSHDEGLTVHADEIQDELASWFAPAGLVPMWPWHASDTIDVAGRQTLATAGLDVRDRDLYLFARSTSRGLLAAGPTAFAASFFGHGMNSYAWTLYDRRPGLRFYAQAHHGVVFGRPTSNAEAQRDLVRLHDLAVLAAPYCRDLDLVVASSPMRRLLTVQLLAPGEDPPSEGRSDALPASEAQRALIDAAVRAGAPEALLTAAWADTRRDWRGRVVDVLATLGSASWSLGDDAYVQCAAWPEGLQVEVAVGQPDEAALFAVRRRLQQDNWQQPQPPEPPNHWQRLHTPVDPDRAVDLLVGAAATVSAPLEPAPDAEQQTANPQEACQATATVASEVPEASRTGRSVLLVPFFKGTADMVKQALRAWLTATTDRPTAVIDLFGVDVEDAPAARFRLPDQMEAATQATQARIRLTVKPDRVSSFADRAEQLRLLLELADATRVLTGQGRDVAVVAPWALPGSWWLFAAAVHSVADAAVVCAHPHPDDTGVWDGLASVLGHRQLHAFADVHRGLVAVTDDGERLDRLAEATGMHTIEAVAVNAEPWELEYGIRAAVQEAMEGED